MSSSPRGKWCQHLQRLLLQGQQTPHHTNQMLSSAVCALSDGSCGQDQMLYDDYDVLRIITSIIRFVSHVDVVCDESQVSNLHLLVDEACCIGRDEDWTTKICRKISGKSLVRYSVALVVVDSAIPNNRLLALKDTIKDLLFVTDCSRNRAVWYIIQTDDHWVRNEVLWKVK